MRTAPPALAIALACAACGSPQVDQHGDTHGYLVLASGSVEQGWAAVDALRAGLAPAARARIRTAAPIGAGPRMFVDFSGSCAAQADLVRSARSIVARHGVGDLACTDTPPAQS